MSQTKLGRRPTGFGRQVACTLPTEMEKELRDVAERKRWTLSTAIRVAVEEYLQRHRSR